MMHKCFEKNNHNGNCISSTNWLEAKYQSRINVLSSTPYRSAQFIEEKAARQIKKVLKHAYLNTQFFKEKFDEHNISISAFENIDDIKKFPIIRKEILLDRNKKDLLDKKSLKTKLFRTTSCGTTTKRKHSIYFNKKAIIEDTLQGVQQLLVQSRPLKPITDEDIFTHYYVNPWWTNSIDNVWHTHFISSDTIAQSAAKQIVKNKPAVIGGYPSNIKSLMPYLSSENLNLKLIITNSEFSTRAERNLLSKHFGCPVLDEYSSEELTRIALEMHDGNYYVCSDSVYLEVVNPATNTPVPDGTWGEAIATSLFNTTMPFIRYATGDWVQKAKPSKTSGSDGLNWPKLSGMGGRIIDSLVSPSTHKVWPQSILLEEIEQYQMENYLSFLDYRIYQMETLNIQLYTQIAHGTCPEVTSNFIKHSKSVLQKYLGDEINIKTTSTTECLFEIDNKITNKEIETETKTTSIGKKRRRIQFLGDIQKYLAG